MARKTSKFMVGLFTTLGVVIGVMAIIWVGASKYFEKGARYVTYFDESVQGLQKDSAVKYRGVEVGRVETIRVAPDNKLIGVVMKVNLEGRFTQAPRWPSSRWPGSRAWCSWTWTARNRARRTSLPRSTFLPNIPSSPPALRRSQKIMAGVNVVVDKFNQIDIQGVFNQLKSTAAEIEIFFRGKKMEVHPGETSRPPWPIPRKSRPGWTRPWPPTGWRRRWWRPVAPSRRPGSCWPRCKDEMRAMNLPETLGKTRAIAAEVGATSENLRRTSETLEAFMGRINDRPSDLLFGKPPKGRFNE